MNAQRKPLCFSTLTIVGASSHHGRPTGGVPSRARTGFPFWAFAVPYDRTSFWCWRATLRRLTTIVACLLLPIATPVLSGDCAYSPQYNIQPSNPDRAYEDHGDGTVTDTRTGLMWKRCSEGQAWYEATCNGSARTYTWEAALTAAEESRYAGHADWRLPNVKELSSLVEECRTFPAINNTVFPNTPTSVNSDAYVWSGSPSLYNSQQAWLVHFGYGWTGLNERRYDFRVRLVRDGQ